MPAFAFDMINMGWQLGTCTFGDKAETRLKAPTTLHLQAWPDNLLCSHLLSIISILIQVQVFQTTLYSFDLSGVTCINKAGPCDSCRHSHRYPPWPLHLQSGWFHATIVMCGPPIQACCTQGKDTILLDYLKTSKLCRFSPFEV